MKNDIRLDVMIEQLSYYGHINRMMEKKLPKVHLVWVPLGGGETETTRKNAIHDGLTRNERVPMAFEVVTFRRRRALGSAVKPAFRDILCSQRIP